MNRNYKQTYMQPIIMDENEVEGKYKGSGLVFAIVELRLGTSINK